MTGIENYAFENCTSLTSVIIGNSVTSIGERAFAFCSGLTSITIPNSVKSIESRAFYSCSNLTNVIIGNSVKTFSKYPFYECENLESIVIAATTPPYVDSEHGFDNGDFRTIVVKVPQGSLNAYLKDDFWASFWNIEEFDATSIKDVKMDTNAVTSAPIYNLQGVQIKDAKENLPAGIYIQGGKKMIVR